MKSTGLSSTVCFAGVVVREDVLRAMFITLEEHKMTKMRMLWLAVILISFVVGCGSGETTLSGDDEAAVLAFSEAKTDNLLAGMNTNDYALFSNDFDQDMLKALPQGEFDALKKDRDAKLGLYVSREVNRVAQSGDFYVVIYDAVFEKDDAVTVRVVFHVADPHQVSGLWFSK